jgi:hypothetical protein
MHDDLLRDVGFWRFLLDLDREFAQSARENGCSCGGRLHAGNYFGIRAARTVFLRSVASG